MEDQSAYLNINWIGYDIDNGYEVIAYSESYIAEPGVKTLFSQIK